MTRINAEALGNLRIFNWLFKPAGWMLGSGLRRWLMDPVRTLEGTYIESGQHVVEVGCGTGFFTIPAARMIGDQGRLVALDVLSDYVDVVTRKVQTAELENVQVIKRDGLDAGLKDKSMDAALLFGVIPFPTLPLNKLLPEMHRVLKPEGALAVWLFPIAGLVPGLIVRSGIFTYISKRNGVYNYSPCQPQTYSI